MDLPRNDDRRRLDERRPGEQGLAGQRLRQQRTGQRLADARGGRSEHGPESRHVVQPAGPVPDLRGRVRRGAAALAQGFHRLLGKWRPERSDMDHDRCSMGKHDPALSHTLGPDFPRPVRRLGERVPGLSLRRDRHGRRQQRTLADRRRRGVQPRGSGTQPDPAGDDQRGHDGGHGQGHDPVGPRDTARCRDHER